MRSRGVIRTLIVPAAVFLLITGIGLASYLGNVRETAGSGSASSLSGSSPGADTEMLAHLTDYTHSLGTGEPESAAAADKLLPDVNTMIERLAARLETTPEDIEGWRMLGWSYLQTGQYEEAATAYAKAIELAPNAAELKRSYEEAKARASENDRSDTATTLQTGTSGNGRDGPGVGLKAD